MRIIYPFFYLYLIQLLLLNFATAQTSSEDDANKEVRVIRTESVPIIDGKLDDAIWGNAEVITDFHQTRPGNGAEPSDRTEGLCSI